MNRYLLSISGGADSVYLFYYLINNEIDFDLIHFNHNTRGIDNIKEEKYCENLAKKFNKKIFVFNYFHRDGNFQNEARNFRINSIVKCVKDNNYDGVYLAHHKDDQIENIIMNKSSVGTKIMSNESYQQDVLFKRPLLNVYKEDIYKYLKENNIEYYEDSSNSDLKYYRNKVRSSLSSLTKSDKDKIYDDELSRYNMAKFIEEDVLNINQIKSDVDLYKYLSYHGYYKNHKFIHMVMNSLDVNGNKEFTLDDNYKLYLNYGILSIGQSLYISEECKRLTIGKNSFNLFEFNISVEGLFVRNYKVDDRFYNKKINRYFIDNKIHKQYRNIWPIIVNENDEIVHIIKLEEIL